MGERGLAKPAPLEWKGGGYAMLKAKVENVDGAQVIRFPHEFRINVSEVLLKRVEDGVLMMTRDPWEFFFEGVKKLSDEFPDNVRPQQPELEPRTSEP